MIVHTVHAVEEAASVDEVIVATDDAAIADAVVSHGGRARLTSRSHQSGSDRIAEVLISLSGDYDVVLNVQGDEPEIEASYLDRLVGVHRETNPDVSTLATPITDEVTLKNPACVKVVLGHERVSHYGAVSRALYFSRLPIPYERSRSPGIRHMKHMGVYAYSPHSLLRFTSLQNGMLEDAERLEQLRALENGMTVNVLIVSHGVAGIDTPEDYECFVRRWKSQNKDCL